MRDNWIELQLKEAQKSFAEAPAYLYHDSPLHDIKAAVDKQTPTPECQKENNAKLGGRDDV